MECTGSLGLLVDAVPVERIVTAMVVWSQIGIVGYLLGGVADSAGYAVVGVVPAFAGLLVAGLLYTDRPWRWLVRRWAGLPPFCQRG